MKLLALETATEACSAALLIDGEIHERHKLAPRQHAALILSMLESLLAEAELAPVDLDAVAFGRGPGGFTGLRIAAGVTQGIAFGADLPVVPVSTLAALAQQAIDEGANNVLAALDARMGEVYWGAFAADEHGLVRALGQEQVCDPDQVRWGDAGKWAGIGSGWDLYEESITDRSCAPPDKSFRSRFPRASHVAKIGATIFAAGGSIVAEEAIPVYLRNQVVKI